MQANTTVTPAQLPELLLNVATVCPVFLWRAPGIGKSSLVRSFADSLGLECVSLLGTQLAPEDLIGVPQIVDGRSRFCPPEMIARGKARVGRARVDRSSEWTDFDARPGSRVVGCCCGAWIGATDGWHAVGVDSPTCH
jgi:hypothetical protein